MQLNISAFDMEYVTVFPATLTDKQPSASKVFSDGISRQPDKPIGFREIVATPSVTEDSNPHPLASTSVR